ncbi:phospholipid scramblase 2-like [Pyxicephalus adspersus]|uniref:phospholipid scramblase 2-like n=1 Tax=Pyxicephalus adspersus TaxID=30357 RepID=UPI003B590C76
MEVIVPSVGVIGGSTMNNSTFVTSLSIMNSLKEVNLLVLGPSLQTNIFGNATFEVKSKDEQYVVGIMKNDGEQYAVSFPLDLEVTMKAMIVCSCFFLEDLIYDKRRYVANRPSSD